MAARSRSIVKKPLKRRTRSKRCHLAIEIVSLGKNKFSAVGGQEQYWFYGCQLDNCFEIQLFLGEIDGSHRSTSFPLITRTLASGKFSVSSLRPGSKNRKPAPVSAAPSIPCRAGRDRIRISGSPRSAGRRAPRLFARCLKSSWHLHAIP